MAPGVQNADRAGPIAGAVLVRSLGGGDGYLHDDGAGGGAGEAILVGGEVGNGVGAGRGCVDNNLAGRDGRSPIDAHLYAKVEVLLRAGDGGAEIGVGVAHRDCGGRSGSRGRCRP